MKRSFVILFGITSIVFAACGTGQQKHDTSSGRADTVVNQNPTLVQRDSAILADDSATVETVKGVKLEETNAISQEKEAADKLAKEKGIR